MNTNKISKFVQRVFLYVMAGFVLVACATGPALSDKHRPSTWAQPVGNTELKQELPNLYQVSPVLYRSAQPLAGGLTILNQHQGAQYGLPAEIKTVVSLRSDDGDAQWVEPTGVRYEQIPMRAWKVKDKDVKQFLDLVRNPNNQPVLVHCKHGADRTGVMVAVYRVVEQGWSKGDAIAEMTHGGFGYHTIWTNLIRYIEDLDVAKFKKTASPL